MTLPCGLQPRSGDSSRWSLFVARRSDSYSSTRGLAQPVFSRSFIPSMTESPHPTRIGPGRFLTSPRCSDAGAFSRLRRNSSNAQSNRRAAVRHVPGLHPVQEAASCSPEKSVFRSGGATASVQPSDAFFALTRDAVGLAAPVRDQSDWGSHRPGPPGIPTLHRDVNLAGTCTIVQYFQAGFWEVLATLVQHCSRMTVRMWPRSRSQHHSGSGSDFG